MKNLNIHKVLLYLAAIALLLFVLAWATGSKDFLGPLLVGFFVLLAFGVRGNPVAKGFSYTIMIFAAVTVSLFYPAPFLKWGDFELKTTIVPLLQIIMFGMGSQMNYRDFSGVVRMPKGVLIGLVCQFSIMPFVGLLIATTFGFPPEIAAGIILVGSSPSGMASNVMSFIAKANLALSVTLTAVATLLAPLITPALMQWLAGEMVPVDFWSMTIGIINMVILPIVGGLMFNALAYGKDSRKSILIQVLVYFLIICGKNLMLFLTSEAGSSGIWIQVGKDMAWFLLLPVVAALLFKKWAGGNSAILNKITAFISMAGIGIIITVITAAGRDSLLDIGLLLILACLLHNSTGYFLGYGICKLARLDEKSCRTIALEVGMQNGGLASGIALQMGKVATVGLAPAVFGPLMNITGSSLATWWRRKSPPASG